MNERVITRFENSIAFVTLNRAEKHNALDIPMFLAIKNAIKQIHSRKDIRVVIIHGEGQSFCSGLDIKSVLQEKSNVIKLLWKWWPWGANLAQIVTVGWRKLNVPVIMALHGKCWGGGMQIALGGDFRIAAPDTSLSVMEAKWGLIPDMGGTSALQENVALDQAMKMAMTADCYSASQALEHNLITEIAESPIDTAKRLASKLIARSPDTNRRIKALYQKSWGKPQGKILAGETFNQWKILLGKNQRIAVKREMGEEVDYL